MSRRPAGPVRQHSLQQPPRRQQQIRRQRSTEDEKNRQMHSTSTVTSRNRYTDSTSKCDHHHHITMLDRPKVRVAWSEQPAKSENNGVEIVARQIPTGKSSRPTTGRGSRSIMGRCSLAEKATILYSRQELAERLRLAWRQREENKSNIDIFLAHNMVEERCDSRLSTETNPATVSTPKIQKIQKKNEESDESEVTEKTLEREVNDDKKVDLEITEVQKIDVHKFQTWSLFESKESTISASLDQDQVVSDNDEKEDENKENDESSTEEEKEDKPIIEKKSSISINCNDWNSSITIINNKSEIINEVKPAPTIATKEPDYSQVRLKRSSYQSGLNKAFVGPIIEKPPPPRISSRTNSFQETATRPFRRTSSAPPQRRTQVNIVIETSGISTLHTPDIEPERRIMSASEPSQSTMPKSSITTNRPIKSAPPVKRRSKANKRRGLSMAYSKDGKDEAEDGRGKAKGAKGGKNGLDAKTADVVTMVSLVSSADSESEMDENSPRDDKLICELRNKLPTTPIIKSSNGLSGGIRKPFKSVSFQQDSFDYDSPQPTPTQRLDNSTHCDESLSRTSSLQTRFIALSRTSLSPENTPLLTAAMTVCAAASATITTSASPLPLLQLQPPTKNPLLFCQEAPTSNVETPLTDREKRCLAVPIRDIHDKKRKLVRCRSAVAAPKITDVEKQSSSDTSRTSLQTEIRISQVIAQTSVSLQESNPTKVATNPVMPVAETNLEKEKTSPAEPYCQTPKEKECWHLYRKMCDKGVFVSFDTVLRGMLTPTEYRLRQKEMS